MSPAHPKILIGFCRDPLYVHGCGQDIDQSNRHRICLGSWNHHRVRKPEHKRYVDQLFIEAVAMTELSVLEKLFSVVRRNHNKAFSAVGR